ncbi:hypothetical protein [Microbacterium hominis]|uniref:Uncharacterized protein n=1 Tax=Microbacterium hominis TaxID=162426 RepID=A0A0B4D2N8_9MICO|nr:hypothetical protein [Microbacterium hominis]KIC58525.1 hypothetical protein RM52_05700 [Microbacterium hominis]
MQLSLPPLRASRGRLSLLLAAFIATAAVFVALAAPTPAFASEPSQNDVEQSIAHGTVSADIASGRLSQAQLEKAARAGLTVNGHRLAPWVGLSASDQAHAADLAAHDPSVTSLVASIRSNSTVADADLNTSLQSGSTTTFAPSDPNETTIPDPSVSLHWWDRLIHNHEYWISGEVVKTIITVGAGAYLAALCIGLDLSKLSCTALGVLVAGAAEFIKSGSCGRGYYFDFPEVWKSHCA